MTEQRIVVCDGCGEQTDRHDAMLHGWRPYFDGKPGRGIERHRCPACEAERKRKESEAKK